MKKAGAGRREDSPVFEGRGGPSNAPYLVSIPQGKDEFPALSPGPFTGLPRRRRARRPAVYGRLIAPQPPPLPPQPVSTGFCVQCHHVPLLLEQWFGHIHRWPLNHPRRTDLARHPFIPHTPPPPFAQTVQNRGVPCSVLQMGAWRVPAEA